MGLNDTPNALRPHIGFFGRTNAGKSSLLNAITNQDLSVVSDFAGTTTDPVLKAMELLPAGPVVMIDTPGFDDIGALGELRIKKTRQILNKTDLAVLVSSAAEGLSECDKQLIELFKAKDIPYIIVYAKSDLTQASDLRADNEIYVSAKTGQNIDALKELIASKISFVGEDAPILSDLINKNDLVILVMPIDASAPKGRIILPQVQSIRDGLDKGAQMLCVKDTELENALQTSGKTPSLVVTDSQVFGKVMKIVPNDIPLTSFSILMARKKGFLDTALKGARALNKIENGDKILICEGCTHHRRCEDIGTVKLPSWITKYTGKKVEFEFTSGTGFPEDLSPYALVIHCGGCMLTDREVRSRMRAAIDTGVPFTNYGTVIAHINGILERSVQPLFSRGVTP